MDYARAAKGNKFDDIILRINNEFYMEKQMPYQLGILNLLPLGLEI